MVRTAGLEPARSNLREILSLLCLPIPPRPHIIVHYIYTPLGLIGGTNCSSVSHGKYIQVS